MNIVLVTDFSKEAKRAADAAAVLAAQLNGRLLLVHPIPKWTIGLFSAGLRDEVRAALDWRLRAESGRLAKTGVAVSARALTGRPARVIVDAARGFSADLIIVPARRSRLFAPWHTGLAKEVVQGSPIPVLAIRDLEAFRPWISGKRPLKIVIGYDFSRAAEAALGWLSSLSKAGRIDITMAYITWPPEEAARHGIDLFDAFDNPPELERFLQTELRKKSTRHGLRNVSIRTAATWGRKDLQLLALAAGEKADLIVIGTSHRGILNRIRKGSVCRGLARMSPINLTCVPVSYHRRAVAMEGHGENDRRREAKQHARPPVLVTGHDEWPVIQAPRIRYPAKPLEEQGPLGDGHTGKRGRHKNTILN